MGHLWKHHFIGTQVIIINFSFQEKVKNRRIIYEVMNILNDHIFFLHFIAFFQYSRCSFLFLFSYFLDKMV